MSPMRTAALVGAILSTGALVLTAIRDYVEQHGDRRATDARLDVMRQLARRVDNREGRPLSLVR